VGLYLPLELSATIIFGGLIALFASRRNAQPGSAGPGILFAAGLITGEALLGILLAIPIVAGGGPDWLALPVEYQLGAGVGLVVMTAICYGLWRVATRQA